MHESALWRRIEASGISTLAVLGMTKNTGKTVTLNHLLAQAAAARVNVGVTSIGRDGEDRDQVFFFPKPPVMVWPGTLVATARDPLQRSKVRWKLVDSTAIDTPMGEIVVVRALEYGEMEIAGASRNSDQIKILDRLKFRGATLVILDGALGRSHHASPAIADGVVLATGAAIGGGIQDVIRKTRNRLAILGIPQAGEAIRTLCGPVISNGGVGLWNRYGEVQFMGKIPTLNAGRTLLRHIESDTATIALGGAVGRSVWQALTTMAVLHPDLRVVVADGTKLFVENADLVTFQKLGATLVGLNAITVTGVTLNPTSPMGGDFAAEDFLAAARQALSNNAHCVVSDVVLEEELLERGYAQ